MDRKMGNICAGDNSGQRDRGQIGELESGSMMCLDRNEKDEKE